MSRGLILDMPLYRNKQDYSGQNITTVAAGEGTVTLGASGLFQNAHIKGVFRDSGIIGNGNYTMEFIFQANSLNDWGNYYNMAISLGVQGACEYIMQNGAADGLTFGQWGSSGPVVTLSPYCNNKPHRVVGVRYFDGTWWYKSLYIDGRLVGGPMQCAFINSMYKFAIGGLTDSTPITYQVQNLRIWDAKIYNRAKTASEIRIDHEKELNKNRSILYNLYMNIGGGRRRRAMSQTRGGVWI